MRDIGGTGSDGSDGRGKRGLALYIIANEFGVGCKREKGTRRNPGSGARATGWTTSITLDGEHSRGADGLQWCRGSRLARVKLLCLSDIQKEIKAGATGRPHLWSGGGDTELVFIVMTLDEVTSQRQDSQGTSSGAILREKSGSDDKEPSVGNLPEARVMNHVKYKA